MKIGNQHHIDAVVVYLREVNGALVICYREAIPNGAVSGRQELRADAKTTSRIG
jgi:hypothetical protein